MYIQVKDAINRRIIVNKEGLEQILEQIFVQVWSKSKGHTDILRISSTPDRM